ncbi:MAG: mechanosensitive ion channel family protein [Salinimicrobium sp.]
MSERPISASEKNIRISHFRQVLFFLFLTLSLPQLSYAQLPGQPKQEQEKEALPEWPEDPLNRRTPRGTVSGFIKAVADRNFEQAGQYLNMKDASVNASGAQMAQIFETILDRDGQILPYALISNDNEGRTDDDYAYADKIGSINVQGDDIELFVEETKGPDGGPIWLFSGETIEKVNAYRDLQESRFSINRVLPSVLVNREWSGVPIGHWLAIMLLAVFSYVLAWALLKLLLYIIPKLWRKAGTEPTKGILKAFALPIRLYAAVWFFVIFSQEIGISIIVRQRFSRSTVIIGLLAFLILLWRLSEYISRFTKERMLAHGRLSGASVVLFLNRAAKIAIIIFGVIAALGTFGVDVTTGLAALGLGGLALALGAQKTIENLVGSVTLITDQPIRVGDFCRVGETMGTVEKIGMRSTRIRTLDRTLVTIPNGEFSSSRIENFAFRDRFWFHPIFGLRYETTPEQIRYLLVELRSLLYSHPMVTEDPARVRFVELGADSINLEIFTYILASNYDEFLEVKEDLLLRMMDVVNNSGTGFAFPSQTVYFGKDTGLSKEKSKEAEDKVKKWREKGELQIPKFDPEKVKELKGKADYPPEGSSLRKNTGGGKIPGL